MKQHDFYGTNDITSLSYLEFGAIDLTKGSKAVWDFRIHQKAYDWLMLARYANDMAAYLDAIEAVGLRPLPEVVDIYRREVHHRDEDFSVNLDKLLALCLLADNGAAPSFFELGQTIFGCIDGMEFCQRLLRSGGRRRT